MELAPIGNGHVAALVDRRGSIVWWCFPRFDADPVFCRLLSGKQEKGFCDVRLGDGIRAEVRYVRNTAIIETVLEDEAGNAARITDFAPRFLLHERMFHPAQICRRIEPLRGMPRITLRVRPTFQYGQPANKRVIGSNHITYSGGTTDLRLTTDVPVSYIVDETPFAHAMGRCRVRRRVSTSSRIGTCAAVSQPRRSPVARQFENDCESSRTMTPATCGFVDSGSSALMP